jgi:hypothetical protein
LSHPSSPFCFGDFGSRVLHLCLHWLGLQFSYVYFLHNWDGKCIPPCPVIDWDGMSLIFCPGWPQNSILQISASQIAGITGANYHTKPHPSI